MNVPVTQDGIHLGPEARIRLPNVDEALDQGYNLHGADDPDLEGTYSQKLAQKLAQEFIELRARPNTPEVPYLMAMQSIARGYGRAITRLKNDWFKEHEKADAERERLMSRLRESRFSKQGIGALWRYLVPILLGIIGFLTAQVVGGKVPTAVVEKTGTDLPTAAMVIGFVIAGRIILKWWYDRQTDKIGALCDMWSDLADQAYEEGKEEEMRYWRARGCEAWLEYTGEEYPDRLSYRIVMQGDNIRRRRIREHRLSQKQTDFERLQELTRQLKSRLKIFKRGDNLAAAFKKEDEE